MFSSYALQSNVDYDGLKRPHKVDRLAIDRACLLVSNHETSTTSEPIILRALSRPVEG